MDPSTGIHHPSPSRSTLSLSSLALRVGAALVALCSFVAPVRAQEPVDPAEAARFRWKAIRFTPSIAVTNIGVDDNVFNESENSKQDTTAALGPSVSLWADVGRARLSGKTTGQYLYFKEYDNQRSWNTSSEVRLEVPLARLKPFLSGAYVNTRERPGFEIDSRARRRDQMLGLGTDVRLSGKTTLTLTGAHARFAYDKNETFLGATLADALDRDEITERFQFRHALTPLTTFVVSAEAIQDRFAVETTRNADSIRVMPGFELKPFALISGRVAVGYRHFNVLNDQLPDYDGVVAAVDAQYSIAATNFRAMVSRDLEYSFETLFPYYALTVTGLTVTQRLTFVWDLVGRIERQSMSYRNSIATGTPSRVDNGTVYGAGLGYRVGEIVRLGFDLNYYRRTSQANLRGYEGLRLGASVSYGQQQ